MSVSNRDVKFVVTLEAGYELPERCKDKTVLRGELEAQDSMQATVLFLQDVWQFFPTDIETSELRITTELR